MITPIVTTAMFADKYTTIEPGNRRSTIAYYSHEGVDFHSAVSLFKSIDDQKFIICGCGCPVRQLGHYDARPGLACVDCLMRERRKDSDVLPAARRAKSTKPVLSAAKPAAKRRRAAKAPRCLVLS